MTTYTIWKRLELSVDVEADSPEQAIEKMLHMDDTKFIVHECDYGIQEET